MTDIVAKNLFEKEEMAKKMDKLLVNLEFDKLLEIVGSYTISAASKAEIFSRIVPEKNITQANALLDQTEEAYKLYHIQNFRPLLPFDDAADVIAKSRVAAMLSPKELRKIFFLLRAGRVARKTILGGAEIRLLKEIVMRFLGDHALEKQIDDAILGENEISDNASEKLRTIRRKLTAARLKLSEKIKQYSKTSEVSKYLQDDIVTVREGRYVLPVKAEYRPSVPGLVHDRSASGATVFVEPFAVVEMNNEIKSLIFEEQCEIERILTELTALVAAIADDLDSTQEALIELDLIFAKMQFSVDFSCTRPTLNNDGYIKLIKARHPLIARDRVVPVTLEVGGENCRILTVTGPNTGGKTVALKTAGLFCILAAAGIFLPVAEGSAAAVFDNVYSDIGDEQSISSSLSTFSSHIKNIVFILENITKNSLVLFDELGAGTDPEEGAALAIGILKYLERVGCSGIVTTHYGQLKEYALTSKTIKNASMQFDEVTLRPTYRLVAGLAGSSNALKIAKTLGVSDFVINEALNSLSAEKISLEKVLSSAEQMRSRALVELEAIERERAEVKRLRTELAEERQRLKEKTDSIQANARAEIKRIAGNSAVQAAELIEEIKQKLKDADEKALLEARQLYKKIEGLRYEGGGSGDLNGSGGEKLHPADPQKIKVGTDVIIISLGARGRVLSVNPAKKEAQIQAGVAISNIKFDNIALAEAESRSKKMVVEKKKVSAAASEEVSVIGQTVAEAVEIIEPIIMSLAEQNPDDGHGVLRIIHGKGTGALGRGIQQYLKSNKSVATYRYGRYGEGDTGVTIAEIK